MGEKINAQDFVEYLQALDNWIVVLLFSTFVYEIKLSTLL